jgi:hypothetical protein
MCAAELMWSEFETRLQKELAACSSRFHRLLLVSQYWNSAFRLFVNPATGEVLPSPVAEKVAHLHTRMFEQWLCMPLAEQFQELVAFLSTLENGDRQTFVFLLRCSEARAALVPANANSREVQLFTSDLDALLTSDRIPDPGKQE